MKFELNDHEVDLLRETVEAAIVDLNKAIASEGLPDRRELRERRVLLRSLFEQMPTRTPR